jgi:hypothetical protein
MVDTADEIIRLRLKGEALREVAERAANPASRFIALRLAAECDLMADHAEAVAEQRRAKEKIAS